MHTYSIGYNNLPLPATPHGEVRQLATTFITTLTQNMLASFRQPPGIEAQSTDLERLLRRNTANRWLFNDVMSTIAATPPSIGQLENSVKIISWGHRQSLINRALKLTNQFRGRAISLVSAVMELHVKNLTEFVVHAAQRGKDNLTRHQYEMGRRVAGYSLDSATRLIHEFSRLGLQHQHSEFLRLSATLYTSQHVFRHALRHQHRDTEFEPTWHLLNTQSPSSAIKLTNLMIRLRKPQVLTALLPYIPFAQAKVVLRTLCEAGLTATVSDRLLKVSGDALHALCQAPQPLRVTHRTALGMTLLQGGLSRLQPYIPKLESHLYPTKNERARLTAALHHLQNLPVDSIKDLEQLQSWVGGAIGLLDSKDNSDPFTAEELVTLRQSTTAILRSFPLLERSMLACRTLDDVLQPTGKTLREYFQVLGRARVYDLALRGLSTPNADPVPLWFSAIHLLEGRPQIVEKHRGFNGTDQYVQINMMQQLIRSCPSFGQHPDAPALSKVFQESIEWATPISVLVGNPYSEIAPHLLSLLNYELREQFRVLPPGASRLVPLGWNLPKTTVAGHAMWGWVRRSTTHRDSFCLSLINSGAGIERHRALQPLFGGHIKRALDHSIRDVTYSDLIAYLTNLTPLMLPAKYNNPLFRMVHGHPQSREAMIAKCALDAHYNPLNTLVYQGKARWTSGNRYSRPQMDKSCVIEGLKRIWNFSLPHPIYKGVHIESKMLAFTKASARFVTKDQELFDWAVVELGDSLLKVLLKRLIDRSRDPASIVNLLIALEKKRQWIPSATIQQLVERVCRDKNWDASLSILEWLAKTHPVKALEALDIITFHAPPDITDSLARAIANNTKGMLAEPTQAAVAAKLQSYRYHLRFGGPWHSVIAQADAEGQAWQAFFRRYNIVLGRRG